MDLSAERRRAPRDPAADLDAEDLVRPYEPPPLGDLPLCVPLPAGWFDDPGYQLWPYAYAGCAEPPSQFGVLGTTLRAGELVAMSYDGGFAHAYFGPPGSGKSYIEGVHLESALLRDRYQTRLLTPLCGVSLSYGRHGGGAHGPEQLLSRLPNQDPEEVRALIHDHGTLPQGIPDVVALTLKRNVRALREEHPHCQVLGLGFACSDLGISGLEALMTMDEREDSLLAAELADLLGALPAGFLREDLLRAVEVYPFRDRRLRHLVRRRVELAGDLIDDRVRLRALVRPGRLIVVDLRDRWLPPARAMKIFQILLNVLVLGEGPLPCGLLLCIDEAHKLLQHAALRRQIEHVIRERRHLGVSVILSSQDPAEVPHSTLAELCGVGLFATESERAIRHLARDVEPFSDLRPADLQALRPGQMVLWSRRFCTPYRPGEFAGKLVRVQVRPRLSHHGGATRTATGPRP